MVETLVFLPSESPDCDWLRGLKVPSLHLCAPTEGCPAQPGDHLSPRVALDLAEARKPGRILIGDLRCAAALRALHEAGWRAERIGTRRFGGDSNGDEASDPDSGFSVREQLAAACRSPLDLEPRRAGAWERDGWAGLSALGIAWDQANRQVAALAGGDQPWQAFRTNADERHRRELDDLILALVPEQDTERTADALQTPSEPRDRYGAHLSAEAPCPADRDPRDYVQAMHRREPVAVKPVLVLGHTGAVATLDAVSRVEYRGRRSQGGWLRGLIDAPDLGQGFNLTLGIGRYRCRLVAELRDGADEHWVDALVSRLLSVALVTGRPLRHYGCTFYLPLDLHLDAELNPPAGAGQHPAAEAPASLAKALAARDPGHKICTPAQAVDLLSRTISDAKDHGTDQRCRVARGDLAEDVKEAQALLYFLPALRERIFDTADSPVDDSIRHWRLPLDPPAALHMTVEQEGGDPSSHTARIRDVSLYGHRNDLFVLAICAGMTEDQETAAEGLTADGPGWWRPLFVSKASFEQIQGLQVERWLWFTKAARLLRPGFPQQELEGKIAKVSLTGPGCHQETFDHTRAFSPIVLCLLERLAGIKLPGSSERLRQVRDDRMVVNCAYGLAGPAPGDDPFARAARERLFSLALYVDRGTDAFASQDGYAYDRAFAQDQMAGQVNRRWAGVGTLYGYTNYSNCAMGFGDTFCGPVARVHIQYIYGRMLLLALFYELTLTYFDRSIAGATLALARPGLDPIAETESFNRLHARFIAFTNDHWFREVSSQTQGAETFALQTRALSLDDKYALVKDKLDRSDAFIEQTRGRLLAEQGLRLGKIGNRLAGKAQTLTRAAMWAALAALWLALVAPTVAVLQMVPDAAERAGLMGVLARVFDGAAWAHAGWPIVSGAILVGLSALVLGVALWRIWDLVRRARVTDEGTDQR